jgi:hypothetical protein
MAIGAPEKQYSAGIYSYVWRQENIQILVDHIAESSKGELSGEINIKTAAPGKAPHIHWARLNLTSTTARNAVNKACSERVPELDWPAIIEQACVLTMARHREGEPVLDLGDEPEYQPRRYRVYPLILEGEPNLIYAPGKTGKSYLALFLACLVQYNIIGLNNWTPDSGNALILDYETNYRSYKQRTWAVKQGLGLDIPFDAQEKIKYRRCYQPLASEIATIRKYIIEHKINLVIVDSAGYASGGDPNEAAIALAYYAALNSLKITSLTLDHVSKNSFGEKTPFGSVYKTNSARNVWELQKNQEAAQLEYDLGLYHRAMNDGMLQKPIGYHVKFTNNDDGQALKVVFSQSNIEDNAELAKKLPIKDQVINVLRRQHLSNKEIHDALPDINPDSIDVTLTRNTKDFIKMPDKTWGVLVDRNDVS